MADGNFAGASQAAREAAYSTPLEDFDLSRPELFASNSHWPWFERLRAEEPVHYCRQSRFGPYWSVTKYNDIMTVDTNHEVFSSAAGGIAIFDPKPNFRRPPSFIGMDPPLHDDQRKAVSPVVSPANLHLMEPIIRERAGKILDELPIGEPFDWVDRVSVELTTQMLATLFDFPFEERRRLTYWSDVTTTFPRPGALVESEAEKDRILNEDCLGAFIKLWNERVNQPPRGDLISMMAHAESTRHMTPEELLSNVILLIIGGNDTTRNSISGGLWALNQNPDQYAKLRANPSLIPSMVSEIIRWQTPLAHMRRTALADFELGGKTIKKGDKVVMWYISGNRDDEVIENPNAFIIDRPRPRQHMSFGFGIHRCVGNRLAEMQLRVVWEEILKRWPFLDVVAPPKHVMSNFIHGYEQMMVRIPA